MSDQNWEEIRTAYQVARHGTVSAAAAALGVHHATVIRHVNAIEARLEVKLFQRHARGYTPTEAGAELLKVASATDDLLTQMVGRIKGRTDQVSGELVITVIDGIAALLAPAITRFQLEYPELHIRLLSDQRVFRLEYGEAHIAVRAGPKPQEPDNVVQHLGTFQPVLCASAGYAKRYGIPKNLVEFAEHRFVGVHGAHTRAPFSQWLSSHVPENNFVLLTSDQVAVEAAMRAGVGIGFLSRLTGSDDPDLVQIWRGEAAWDWSLWLVTHVDLHRMPRVQVGLKWLKDEVATWQKV